MAASVRRWRGSRTAPVGSRAMSRSGTAARKTPRTLLYRVLIVFRREWLVGHPLDPGPDVRVPDVAKLVPAEPGHVGSASRACGRAARVRDDARCARFGHRSNSGCSLAGRASVSAGEGLRGLRAQTRRRSM